MQITNNHNLPETLVRAIRNDDYSKGDADYSCTELINSPRITLLKQRHEDEIVEDASKRIWALYGKFGHKLLEQAGADNAFMEERLFEEVLGRKISGASDLAQWVFELGSLGYGRITDYKFTSVWTWIYGDRIVEWEQQQNIYAWFIRKAGFGVNSLQVCAFFRDWRLSESKQQGSDYPAEAEIVPLKLWTLEQQEEFIQERLGILMQAERLPDDELPECTPEEMWEKPTVYAVMKDGAKRSTKNFEDQYKAENHAAKLTTTTKGKLVKYTVDVRPGQRTRCQEYCSVNRFCNQYQDYVNRNGNREGDS